MVADLAVVDRDRTGRRGRDEELGREALRSFGRWGPVRERDERARRPRRGPPLRRPRAPRRCGLRSRRRRGRSAGQSPGSTRPPGNTHIPPANARRESRRSIRVSSPLGRVAQQDDGGRGDDRDRLGSLGGAGPTLEPLLFRVHGGPTYRRATPHTILIFSARKNPDRGRRVERCPRCRWSRCAASPSATAGCRQLPGSTSRCERGQVCGLLGPNGAGKTTALRMLVGLIRPTAGEARLFDRVVRPGAPELDKVGAMIEHAAFVPHLSGMRNLRLWWEAGGAAWADADLDARARGRGAGRRDRTAGEDVLPGHAPATRPRPGAARPARAAPARRAHERPGPPGDARGARAAARALGPRRHGAALEPPALRDRAGLQPRRRHGQGPAGHDGDRARPALGQHLGVLRGRRRRARDAGARPSAPAWPG